MRNNSDCIESNSDCIDAIPIAQGAIQIAQGANEPAKGIELSSVREFYHDPFELLRYNNHESIVYSVNRLRKRLTLLLSLVMWY